jgi:hypothetical protein
MIHENEVLPVIYLYDEEIAHFKESASIYTIGNAYTWENEDVVHLHISQVMHSFGKKTKCLFTSSSVSSDILELCDKEDIEWLVSTYDDNISVFHSPFELCEINVNVVPAKADLYSRSKGILEIGILENKHVAIIGLGSFGSQIAIELSKAGVGEYS